jgi:O-antigen ligase
MTIINPILRDKIYYYLILVLSLVLPVYDKLVPPVIALIGLNWLLELNFKEKFFRVKNSSANKYLISFGLLYILYIIGTLYSSELKGGSGAFFDLEVKLALLLFPLFFSTIDFTGIRKDLIKKALYFFVLGCIINSLFIFNHAVFQYFKDYQTSVFFYSNLSMIYHPGYLALYYSFALMILLDWTLKNRRFSFKLVMAILLILYFQVFIVLLSSKAGISGLFIVLLMIALYFLIFNYLKSIFPVTLSVLLIFSLFLMLALFPQSFNRFSEAGKAISDNSTPENQKSDGTTARVVIWKSSWQIIKENPLFGVGTGDIRKELLEKYKENQISISLYNQLNVHNQYLQTFVALGIPGFLVLLAGFVLPGLYALKRKQLLYLSFLTLFAVHILVESMLERQAGVVFYAFYNALLFRGMSLENTESNHELTEV